MEYRRLGKTGWMVSAVCLGGHWKRVHTVLKTPPVDPCNLPTDPGVLAAFHKNRHDVVSRCIESGINLIDIAGDGERDAYAQALEGRRESMYLAYSHPASEMRVPANRTAGKLVDLLEAGLRRCKLEYVDIWRCMALEQGGQHSRGEHEEMIKALDSAKSKGLCRHTGVSTHDRKWAKMLIEKYPDLIQVVVFPYTAKSKALPEDSLFDAVRKHDVGTLGIKPFASNSLFKGDSAPDGPDAEEDDQRARMALRYILANPAITAPIPGLVSARQVDNAVRAVKERRELDRQEKAELKRATDAMWARLPRDYQWLKDWEYV
jgi:aryl-alcohol dehydrogenase-like predicted oxidoreductase